MRESRRKKADFGVFRRRPHPRKRKSVELLAIATGVIGLVSLVLLLLGFGVALSMESWGQIPYGALYSSPTELIALSAIAVSRFIVRFGTADMAWQIAFDAAPVGLFVGIFVVVLVLLMAWPRRPSVDRLQSVMTCMRAWPREFVSTKTKTKAAVSSFVAGIVAFAIFPLIAVIYLWATVTGAAIVGLTPLVGFVMGKLYIDEYVTGPTRCADGQAGTRPAATCLYVKTKELGEYRGRLVYGTSSVVVLYDATASGPYKVIRIPLAEAVVVAEFPSKKISSSKK
ncbi:MAG: hypothetical protein ACJ8HJ_20120 [Massilia sp.]